jgi:hypothetical protein
LIFFRRIILFPLLQAFGPVLIGSAAKEEIDGEEGQKTKGRQTAVIDFWLVCRINVAHHREKNRQQAPADEEVISQMPGGILAVPKNRPILHGGNQNRDQEHQRSGEDEYGMTLRGTAALKISSQVGRGVVDIKFLGESRYQPITIFDSITRRERSRSEPVCCI